MADEPKNKIENVLQAYARKRREEAGAFEMHPATREMLQSEAAKLRQKAATRPRNWLSALFEFGPRLGFALSILVVLAIVLLTWRSPSRMQMASTQTKPPEVADDRLSESLSTHGESDFSRLAKDAEGRRAILSEEIRDEQVNAEKEQLGRSSDFRRKDDTDKKVKLGVEVALQDRTPAEPMPAGPAPAESAAITERSLALRETDAFQGQKPLNQPDGARRLAGVALADNVSTNMTLFSAASAPSNAEQFSVFYSQPSTSQFLTVQQRFYKAQSPERSDQSGARLLEDFELQRTGDQIRIIDSDGSVYEGAIAAHRAELETRGEKAELEAAKRSARLNVRTAGEPSSVAGTSPPAETPISFRATGTNRTLNELVVFDGTIRSGQGAPGEPYFAKGVQAQSADSPAVRQRLPEQSSLGRAPARPESRVQTVQQPFTNRTLRLEGKARVGATNQLEIRALPR